MAAASRPESPERFISGIEITPVDATFETALPEMVPNKADATIAIFELPPRSPPIVATARSEKKSPPPALDSTTPNRIKGRTTVAPMLRGSPTMAVVSQARWAARSGTPQGRATNGSGRYDPRRPYARNTKTITTRDHPTRRRSASMTRGMRTIPTIAASSRW